MCVCEAHKQNTWKFVPGTRCSGKSYNDKDGDGDADEEADGDDDN